MKKNRKRILGIIIILILFIILFFLLWQTTEKEKEIEVPFAGPAGMMLTEDGSIYVADSDNNNVLRMENDKTWLVAGKTLPLNAMGVAEGGYMDGEKYDALFNEPQDVASWGDGIAVSDSKNHCIRLITEDSVRTLAGIGVQGAHNGPAYQASFHTPTGLATDENGNLYIADTGNGNIRCLSPEGVVTTVAQGIDEPMGLCWYEGELYITAAGSNQILKQDTSGELSVIAGAGYSEEDMERKDGAALEATFSGPQGIEIVDGIIYVADTGFSAVRKIENGQVTTLQAFEGTGKNIWPSMPVGIVYYQQKLYISDIFHGVIFTLDLSE